jgi:hypothetical protein
VAEAMLVAMLWLELSDAPHTTAGAGKWLTGLICPRRRRHVRTLLGLMTNAGLVRRTGPRWRVPGTGTDWGMTEKGSSIFWQAVTGPGGLPADLYHEVKYLYGAAPRAASWALVRHLFTASPAGRDMCCRRHARLGPGPGAPGRVRADRAGGQVAASDQVDAAALVAAVMLTVLVHLDAWGPGTTTRSLARCLTRAICPRRRHLVSTLLWLMHRAGLVGLGPHGGWAIAQKGTATLGSAAGPDGVPEYLYALVPWLYARGGRARWSLLRSLYRASAYGRGYPCWCHTPGVHRAVDFAHDLVCAPRR